MRRMESLLCCTLYIVAHVLFINVFICRALAFVISSIFKIFPYSLLYALLVSIAYTSIAFIYKSVLFLMLLSLFPIVKYSTISRC